MVSGQQMTSISCLSITKNQFYLIMTTIIVNRRLILRAYNAPTYGALVLTDVIPSIGPKISDVDTKYSIVSADLTRLPHF